MTEPAAANTSSYEPPVAATVVMIDIGRLLEHPDNPRGPVVPADCEELAASVAEQGQILQPLLVVPFKSAFRVIAGARRRMAGKLNNLPRLPCIICSMTESQQHDVMLIENLQRKDLTYLQTARAFMRMVQEEQADKQEIVRRIGCSVSFVTNLLKLAILSPPVQELIDSGRLALSMSPVLARISDPSQQKQIASIALQKRMSVAALQASVDELLSANTVANGNGSSGPSPQRRSRRRVLGETEVFTRTQALAELDSEGVATFNQLAAAFDDVCLGTCIEHRNMEMCEACPVPRFIMSVLRRVRFPQSDTSAPISPPLEERASQGAISTQL